MKISRSWQIAFFGTFVLATAAQAADTDEIAEGIKCYRGLIGNSVGANFMLANDGEVVLPATRNGIAGFYVYDKSLAYFQALPSTPNDSNNQMNYYYLQLQIPGRADKYITYSDRKGHPNSPSMMTGTKPLDALKGKYHLVKPGESLDDKARSAFNAELLKRIETVAAQYASRKKKMGERPNSIYNDYVLNYNDYVDALDSCSGVADKAVKLAIKGQRDTLAKMNPIIEGTNSREGRVNHGAPAQQ